MSAGRSTATEDFTLYPFHHANIHELRWAARVARAMPITILLATCVLVAVGVFKQTVLLLTVCAVLNMTMWLWVSSAAMFGIVGSHRVKESVRLAEEAIVARQAMDATKSEEERKAEQVTHVIVFPNYKEEEAMLADTLRCIQEATGSERFIVVLAMEEREGAAGVKKAESLRTQFTSSFRKVFATYHPTGQKSVHLDGSEDEEVPGKASNLKWAVKAAYDDCAKDATLDLDRVLLTVADADCLFHPCYFAHLEEEFRVMSACPGEQHKWTMWQAPQLPYRNYYISPAPARVWAYISSMYEFGGVSSIVSGGHHMVFSAYSCHIQLAEAAQLWDGDIIAEDHHAYIKGFFYSAHKAAQDILEDLKFGGGTRASWGVRPALRVRPVMLPVKSTSVVSPDGYWASWVERWHQATRHCQGVAEVSYSMLATWDMLSTLPRGVYNMHFVMHLMKVVLKPLVMHVIPICQAIALGVLTLYWVIHNRSVPQCPDRIYMASSDGETLLCGLAGAWALTWPVMIPFALVATANFRFLKACFMEPQEEHPNKSMWHRADADIPPTWGSQTLTLVGLILFDSAVLMGPMMVPYGLCAEIVGCWNVLVRGNHFTYVTAAKMTSNGGPDYGSMKNSV